MEATDIVIDGSAYSMLKNALSKTTSPVVSGPARYKAVVSGVDDSGMTWVNIVGGAENTPVEDMQITAKAGDVIDVEIENGRAKGMASGGETQAVTLGLLATILGGASGAISSKELATTVGEYSKLYAYELIANHATIGDMAVNVADIGELRTNVADIDKLVANNARVEKLDVKNLSAENAAILKLIASAAYIEQLQANEITVLDMLADKADIKDLTAGKVTVTDLAASKLDVSNLDAKYAKIDFANVASADISEAWVESLMARSGWFVDNVTVSGDQTITGQLKSVLIDGDTAHFANIYADALKILGEDGLYHRLNFMNYDETLTYEEVHPDGTENPFESGWYELIENEYFRSGDETVDSEKTYYEIVGFSDEFTQSLVDDYGDALNEALHGSNIIAQSITATQLDASSVRTALLEVNTVQIGATASAHIHMTGGMLRFYAGDSIVYNMTEPDGTENPLESEWYEYDPESNAYYHTYDETVDWDKTYYTMSDSVVAYISNQELYIPRTTVKRTMAIGDPTLGQWRWETNADQDLSLYWIEPVE